MAGGNKANMVQTTPAVIATSPWPAPPQATRDFEHAALRLEPPKVYSEGRAAD